MHKIIEDLNWRYATKRFDPDHKISEGDLNIIKEGLRLVATSYGLQSMKFIFVEDPAVREKLLDASYNQNQVVDASNLLVMCSYLDINDADIDQYTENIAETREQQIEELDGFANHMKKTIRNMDQEDRLNWSKRQVYIALGHLLSILASLRIDSTPMEGFKVEEYDHILGLKEKNLTAVLVCPIGYRHTDDHAQFRTKVRKPLNALFETL